MRVSSLIYANQIRSPVPAVTCAAIPGRQVQTWSCYPKIVSCYEPQTLRALLACTWAYLSSGGRVLIHEFALYANRSGPHNAALFHFGELSGMASTTTYTVDELGVAMQEAGFVDVAMQPFLPDLTFLVSGRKP